MNLEDLLKDKKDKNFVGYVSACESGGVDNNGEYV